MTWQKGSGTEGVVARTVPDGSDPATPPVWSVKF